MSFWPSQTLPPPPMPISRRANKTNSRPSEPEPPRIAAKGDGQPPSSAAEEGFESPIEANRRILERRTLASPLPERIPGIGQFADGPKSWETAPNSVFRDEIARAERSRDKPNHGYLEYNSLGPQPRGRYQLTRQALVDSGWLDHDGTWTLKARRHGVHRLEDFLTKPDAQEASMSDAMRRNEEQATANGAYNFIGTKYAGQKGSIIVTKAGIAAASHRQGAGATREYLELVKVSGGNTKAIFEQLERKGDKEARNQLEKLRSIETRMREFQDVPYQPIVP